MIRKIQIGDRFNRWSVIKKADGWAKWLAVCDCGTKKVVQSSHLYSGQSKSCGCLRDEMGRKRATKHGHCRTAEYRTWRGIRNRCNNPTNRDYPNYGGRGITVCKRWDTFINFLEDMGKKPSQSYSIERRDNSKGYAPNNCYWATRKQQSENRRSSQYVVFANEKITVAEAARRLKMHRSSIWNYATSHNITRQQAVDHYIETRLS